MKTRAKEAGSALVMALTTVVILSLIGYSVLNNCTTRYNVISSQVRGWKAALRAAESGGDIAFANIRNTVLDPTTAWTGWTAGTFNGNPGYISTIANLPGGLSTRSVADKFYTDPVTGNPWWRVRTYGTALLPGLKRTGMDDRMTTGNRFAAGALNRGDGDSLLRKIDFQNDHYVATYGPAGDGVGKVIQSVGSTPTITRRIEQILSPKGSFGAPMRCTQAFNGPGSAGVIDSYRSSVGTYVFVANNPSHPRYVDSRAGNVAVNTGSFDVDGDIWGNVTTNGGNVVPNSRIHGTIDNSVPFILEPLKLPTLPTSQASPLNANSGTTTIIPPSEGTAAVPITYTLSSISGKLDIKPAAGATRTFVAIRVLGDITNEILVRDGVTVQIYFHGNVHFKGRDMINESNKAGNLQFYGISPTGNPPPQQTIEIDSPGNFAATFYAPTATVDIRGNPDILGAITCKTFYGNGNTSVHYDRDLDDLGDVQDYYFASYIEDTR